MGWEIRGFFGGIVSLRWMGDGVPFFLFSKKKERAFIKSPPHPLPHTLRGDTYNKMSPSIKVQDGKGWEIGDDRSIHIHIRGVGEF